MVYLKKHYYSINAKKYHFKFIISELFGTIEPYNTLKGKKL